MNTKFLKAFAAIAFMAVASSPLAFAAKVTPSQFNAELKKKVGTKKGLAAANAAAKYFGATLKDKLNKKLAPKYASMVVKVLQKPSLSGPFAGSSINACVKQLLTGYFKGVKFSLTDATYTKALDTLMKKLPPTARTEVTSQSIYNTIKAFAEKNGSTQSQVFAYYTTSVSNKFNLPEPTVS